MTSAGESHVTRPTQMSDFPANIQKLATVVQNARTQNRQLPGPLTSQEPHLNQNQAYHIAAAIRTIRQSNGEKVVGRKIGFTNKNIWPEYGIDASNWSYMYDSTVVYLPDMAAPGEDGTAAMIDLSDISELEPKLEPEIVLHLASTPKASMSDEEMLDCVDWIAHGYEIVQSIFPGWKFTAIDTTAAFALHGKLLVGPRVPVKALGRPDELLRALHQFRISLRKNETIVDEGTGANVLGSPVKALKHLCELLEKDRYNPPLAAGEIVTTGTLTRAWELNNDSIWRTGLGDLNLSGLTVLISGLLY